MFFLPSHRIAPRGPLPSYSEGPTTMLRIRFARFAVLILCLAGVQPVGPCTRDASAEPESATREADVLNSERLLEDMRAQLETRTPHSTRSTEDAVCAGRERSGD